MQVYDVIKRPIVTEKSIKGANVGKYWFEVDSSAKKYDVKLAIEEIYGVKPKKINIIKSPKKERVVGRGRTFTKRKNETKVVVTLEKGKSIDQTKIKVKK